MHVCVDAWNTHRGDVVGLEVVDDLADGVEPLLDGEDEGVVHRAHERRHLLQGKGCGFWVDRWGGGGFERAWSRGGLPKTSPNTQPPNKATAIKSTCLSGGQVGGVLEADGE